MSLLHVISTILKSKTNDIGTQPYRISEKLLRACIKKCQMFRKSVTVDRPTDHKVTHQFRLKYVSPPSEWIVQVLLSKMPHCDVQQLQCVVYALANREDV